jgi:hypothetical protein
MIDVAEALVRKTAAALPEAYRERWRDEWLADLESLGSRPLIRWTYAVRVAWYSPVMRRLLRDSDAPRTQATDRRKERANEVLSRRLQLRGQAGRFLVLAPIAAILAFIGGALLQWIAAPDWCGFAFAIAVTGGAILQILLPGAGLPRPGLPRGTPVDFPTHPVPARPSGEYRPVRQRV